MAMFDQFPANTTIRASDATRPIILGVALFVALFTVVGIYLYIYLKWRRAKLNAATNTESAIESVFRQPQYSSSPTEAPPPYTAESTPPKYEIDPSRQPEVAQRGHQPEIILEVEALEERNGRRTRDDEGLGLVAMYWPYPV
ncbi:hypothetical protein SAICODRAFT_68748 [Saitoella complicata NRRL Y-17804]|uniref:Uncharacterized protein n=1 Tax=Saitoella complicata (strain BCRC 22490 / CBS 7301 / JCM 7358 / NBRC 10748 / NRRL Y-17804) TaxID=698492 RepID=A0A0E9NS26_SAICN|nr:uncharacterized protein SAICODRAFT_68748 [Saitoella complicata NRRL Y-17804]ODQ56414.1 hypothetical protein SAICODRAFT_68748 [Saitoella complicata NRRL Y-17804]GAO52563.1 hypothetical protein G7K_6636-t1 [Saitoella complicata NRRL Y-17804]